MSIKMRVKYGEGLHGDANDAEPGNFHVTFEAYEGKSVVRSVSFDIFEWPEDIRHGALLYGANKLLTDRTSGEKDKLKKLDAMIEYDALFRSGEWSKERTVGAIVVSPEVEALAAIKGLSVPDTQAALAQYDKETRKAILDTDEVVERAAKIREAREAKDLSGAFDDLI